MMRMRQAFTLVELLVVVGMIAVLMGAMSVAIGGAQKRARIQKAKSDVKVISQAILGYENYSKDHKLPTMMRKEANKTTLAFLLGQGETGENGDKIPALLSAALSSGKGELLDPWGHPYLITIREGNASVDFKVASKDLKMGYFLPNFFRLDKEERSLWAQ